MKIEDGPTEPVRDSIQVAAFALSSDHPNPMSEVIASLVRADLAGGGWSGSEATRLEFLLEALEGGALEELLSGLPVADHGLALLVADRRSSFVRSTTKKFFKSQQRVRFGSKALGKRQPFAALVNRQSLAGVIGDFDQGSAAYLRHDEDCVRGLAVVAFAQDGLFIESVRVQDVGGTNQAKREK